MTAPRRVTGIGGVFFKVRDPATLGEWYRSHMGIDVQFGWITDLEGNRIELWQPPPDR